MISVSDGQVGAVRVVVAGVVAIVPLPSPTTGSLASSTLVASPPVEGEEDGPTFICHEACY